MQSPSASDTPLLDTSSPAGGEVLPGTDVRGSINSADRTAPAPAGHLGRVTLINSFVVPLEAEARFRELWHATSSFFRGQPGFRSLRLHRAVSDDAPYRYVNVVEWDSADLYRAAHEQDRFLRLVAQEGWAEFPSSPALYEEVVEHLEGT